MQQKSTELAVTYNITSDVRDGTVCYTLSIRRGEEVCRLPDIARSLETAERLKALFANGGVTPATAWEVAEELLARDPDVFI